MGNMRIPAVEKEEYSMEAPRKRWSIHYEFRVAEGAVHASAHVVAQASLPNTVRAVAEWAIALGGIDNLAVWVSAERPRTIPRGVQNQGLREDGVTQWRRVIFAEAQAEVLQVGTPNNPQRVIVRFSRVDEYHPGQRRWYEVARSRRPEVIP